jgi:hypothetical protein
LSWLFFARLGKQGHGLGWFASCAGLFIKIYVQWKCCSTGLARFTAVGRARFVRVRSTALGLPSLGLVS